MPIPALAIGLGVAQFGAGALESIAGQRQQEEAVRFANKKTKAQNQFAMQNWQYNEQMRQREQRQQEALYEMRKKEYTLQKELNFDEYEKYYEDAQINFNNLVRDVANQNLAADMQETAAKGSLSTRQAAQGVAGRRSGRAAQNIGLQAGMQKQNRFEALLFQEEQMGMGIERAAKTTNLRNQLAFNRVGPAPEALPVAPMPVMGAMQSGPSQMGMYAGLLQGGLGAVSTVDSLTPGGIFN